MNDDSASSAAELSTTPPTLSMDKDSTSSAAEVSATPPTLSMDNDSTNRSHHITPKRPPLAAIVNRSPLIFNAPASTSHSVLKKYLKPVQINPSKKTGHARVLTSADCLEMLEEKKRKKRLEEQEKGRAKKAAKKE